MVPFLARRAKAAPTPVSRVAVTACTSYGAALVPALDGLFDSLNIGRLVRGKTVAIKINMTGSPKARVGYVPLEDTVYSHPRVIGAVAYLLSRAGARRIRVLEGAFDCSDPLEEFMLQAGWEPNDILNAAPNVEMENTNIAGVARKYHRFQTAGGGHIFPAFDLNHSFADCDVFVSLAKMKEHATAGITLSMKNCFGSTPISIYGGSAGVDEPNENPRGGRGMFHDGDRQPSRSAPGENEPATNRDPGYRVPRIVADIVASRPIDLAIIDGVRSMAGGEGSWISGVSPVRPGILVAGLNPVSTDAVGMALMGFDPMADRGTPPFETSDNTLRLAEELGVGTRDLSRIEVAGPRIDQLRFDFAGPRKVRRARLQADAHA
jgi:uncharacterized protein (DUF362 family)